MIWSEQELQNLALAGVDIAVERVMSKLSLPENEDIFTPEKFSYLWGMLGIAGVKGVDEKARVKIWNALVDNGVVDAFDKGILGDFNKDIARQFNDNRMRAWLGLDNFEAGLKFNKQVLQELVKTNVELKDDVLSHCLNNEKLVDTLFKKELGGNLKVYLEKLRVVHGAKERDGKEIAEVYEKTVALRKLCDVIAYPCRKMTEAEKDYLFHYLREAIHDGFKAEDIGFNDAVLARLMADDVLEGLSEVEASPYLLRNQEIAELAEEFEVNGGFYEEVAAKLIKHEPYRINGLTERCLDMIANNEPKGLIYAMMLLDLNKVKSSVIILQELAKYGRALEMTAFTHRLLPKTKGAEGLILDILKLNLKNLPIKEPYFREYAARRSMGTARDFAECGYYKESASLLSFLIEGEWFGKAKDLVDEFIVQANYLIRQDESLSKDLCFLANKLNLRIYKVDGHYTIGTDENNPLSNARRRFEKAVLGATTIDLSKATKKIGGIEASTYNVFQNIKGVFGEKQNNFGDEGDGFGSNENIEKENNVLEEHVESNGFYEDNVVESNVIAVEDNQAEDNTVYEQNIEENEPDILANDEVMSVVDDVLAGLNVENNGVLPDVDAGFVENEENEAVIERGQREISQTDKLIADSISIAENSGEVIKNEAEDSIEEIFMNIAQKEAIDDVNSATELPKIESWVDDVNDGSSNTNTQNNKANINNILNLNSNELDKHFTKIKSVANSAMRIAEEQALELKKKMQSGDIANSSSVEKIRGVFGVFRKKS